MCCSILRLVFQGCLWEVLGPTAEQWAGKPRLWEAEKKLWNYSGSGRKSVGSGVLPIEMLSLELITSVIRHGLCHRDAGAASGASSSADALLEKSKSLSKLFSSAFKDWSVTEQSVHSLQRHMSSFLCWKICALLQQKVRLLPAFSQEVLVSLLILDLLLKEKCIAFSHFFFCPIFQCFNSVILKFFKSSALSLKYGHQSIFQ